MNTKSTLFSPSFVFKMGNTMDTGSSKEPILISDDDIKNKLVEGGVSHVVVGEVINAFESCRRDLSNGGSQLDNAAKLALEQIHRQVLDAGINAAPKPLRPESTQSGLIIGSNNEVGEQRRQRPSIALNTTQLPHSIPGRHSLLFCLATISYSHSRIKALCQGESMDPLITSILFRVSPLFLIISDTSLAKVSLPKSMVVKYFKAGLINPKSGKDLC